MSTAEHLGETETVETEKDIKADDKDSVVPEGDVVDKATPSADKGEIDEADHTRSRSTSEIAVAVGENGDADGDENVSTDDTAANANEDIDKHEDTSSVNC